MFKRKSTLEIKAVRDQKTGVMFIKVSDGHKSKKKPNGRISYWSTSLLIHDHDEKEEISKLATVKY